MIFGFWRVVSISPFHGEDGFTPGTEEQAVCHEADLHVSIHTKSFLNDMSIAQKDYTWEEGNLLVRFIFVHEHGANRKRVWVIWDQTERRP